MVYIPPINPPSMTDLLTWYKSPSVKFEMIKFTFKREVAFIVASHARDNYKGDRTLRMLRMHNVQDFDYHVRNSRLFKDIIPYNFYYSLMVYDDGIPKGDAVYKNRDWEGWRKHHVEQASGYDLVFDVDSPNHHYIDETYNATKSIKSFFDSRNVPYELRFSGCGFHFIIPHHFLPVKSYDPYGEDNIYTYCKSFALMMYDNFTELIDLNVYDSRRVIKIPYSLSFYDRDCFVCTPILSDKEFNDFWLNNYRPQDYAFILRGRGTYLFNPDGDLRRIKI